MCSVGSFAQLLAILIYVCNAIHNTNQRLTTPMQTPLLQKYTYMYNATSPSSQHVNYLYTHSLLKEIKQCLNEVTLWMVGWFMVCIAIFNNISVISWPSVLLVEETGETHRSVASHVTNFITGNINMKVEQNIKKYQ